MTSILTDCSETAGTEIQAAADTRDRRERILSVCLSGLLLLVCANLLGWRQVDPDLWGHIQYGEDWLAEGALPRVASHTYAAEGYRWINHENLSELALAFLHRLVGGHGIMVAKLAVGTLIILSVIRTARHSGVPLPAASVLAVFVAQGLGTFWLARPQLASFICTALMIGVLEHAFDRENPWRLKRPLSLLWLLPLMVVWTNSHGGFAAGLCILGAVLAIRMVQSYRTEANTRWPDLRIMAMIGVGALTCMLINPYGAGLPGWMLESLGSPRPEITEWAGIFASGPILTSFIALTVLTVVGAVLSTERRDISKLIVISLVAVQSAMHVRHLAFFALLFGYWMPKHCWSAAQRIHHWYRTRHPAREDEPMTAAAFRMLLAEAGVVGLLLGGGLLWQLADFGVSRADHPVSAIEFMDRHGLHGRLVVTFNWAQYALAALGPETEVGFDGRFRTCYPQEVIDMNFDLTNGPDNGRRHREGGRTDPGRVLDYEGPDLVLLERTGDRFGVSYMETRDDWAVLYSDAVAVLWGRRSRFDDPESPAWFAPELRETGTAEQTGKAAWPAMPGRTGRTAFQQAAREYVDRS